MKHLIFILLGMLCVTNGFSQDSLDYRNILNGYSIYENGYIDQPYIVILKDGTWLCLFTTGSEEEGLDGQHIVASRSKDNGKNWTVPVAIEPASGPAASWAMPYLTDYGRVYAFYIYNGDEIKVLEKDTIRNDMLGWYCFKYSDDGGKSWSSRYRLPIRVTAVDRENDFKGEVQLMWGIGKPVDVDEGMMFGFTKLGKYLLDNGEGWFMYCDNIHQEKDPKKLNWEMLPEGDHGLRHPKYGSVQEEHNLFQMNNGDLYCMFRTQLGYATQSYSRDGGRSWSTPSLARYIDGRPIKNTRACPRIWKCNNGKYLLWYHNNSGDYYSSRNPAWLSGGIERNGEIIWSQPEIVIYGEDQSYESGRFSYPDLIEQDGKYWISESSKVKASVHPIPEKLIEGLWQQFERPEDRVIEGLVMEVLDTAILNKGELILEGLPLDHNKASVLLKGMEPDGGITIEFGLKPIAFNHGRMLLDTKDTRGGGLFVQTTGYRQIEVGICNMDYCEMWSTDPGLLDVVNPHDISLIIDNSSKMIMWVIDGKLCDGGTSRQFGFKRYQRYIGTIKTNVKSELRVRKKEIQFLRIYNRPLRVSEAITNYNFYLKG